MHTCLPVYMYLCMHTCVYTYTHTYVHSTYNYSASIYLRLCLCMSVLVRDAYNSLCIFECF